MKRGDTVAFKSGGPLMTVSYVRFDEKTFVDGSREKREILGCIWFDLKGCQHHHEFASDLCEGSNKED